MNQANFDKLLNTMTAEPTALQHVDWEKHRAAIVARISAEMRTAAAGSETLTALVAEQTSLPAIDWNAERESLRRQLLPGTSNRRLIWRIAGLVTAAAAALALLLRSPTAPPTAPPLGSATIVLTVAAQAHPAGQTVASATIHEQTDAAALAEQQRYAAAHAPRPAEIFLIISPAPAAEPEDIALN